MGLKTQHMVMLCKTKGHVKADAALFKTLQGHKAFRAKTKHKGCLRINIPRINIPSSASLECCSKGYAEGQHRKLDTEFLGLIAIRR